MLLPLLLVVAARFLLLFRKFFAAGDVDGELLVASSEALLLESVLSPPRLIKTRNLRSALIAGIYAPSLAACSALARRAARFSIKTGVVAEVELVAAAASSVVASA